MVAKRRVVHFLRVPLHLHFRADLDTRSENIVGFVVPKIRFIIGQRTFERDLFRIGKQFERFVEECEHTFPLVVDKKVEGFKLIFRQSMLRLTDQTLIVIVPGFALTRHLTHDTQ